MTTVSENRNDRPLSSFGGVPLLEHVFTVRCFECNAKCSVPQGVGNVLTMIDFAIYLEKVGWKKNRDNRYLCDFCYAKLNNDTDRL